MLGEALHHESDLGVVTPDPSCSAAAPLKLDCWCTLGSHMDKAESLAVGDDYIVVGIENTCCINRNSSTKRPSTIPVPKLQITIRTTRRTDD